jgi:hypothetical protein
VINRESRSREFRSSDKSRKGDRAGEENLWVIFPDREIEEPWSSSGREEEEDPVRADMLRGVRLCQVWYQSEEDSLLSVAEREREITMLPRREILSPDPEYREVRRRGMPVGNP